MKTLKIATRKSKLALWQAEWVKANLLDLYPELSVELVHIVTKGDKILDVPLAKVGGKGLFVKEIEEALLDGRADIAVHSMKDVPAELPEGLHLPVITKREDPRDAFCAREKGFNFSSLTQGGIVGTSSLRRQVQLKAKFPTIEIKMLRGNVDTRLAKLDAGDYDAIILAAAGLKRLGLAERATEWIAPEMMLPAVGQGAVGIESRIDDQKTNDMIAKLHHQETAYAVDAERAFLATLEGGCQVPIGCYGLIDDGKLYLRGLIGDEHGKLIQDERRGAPTDGKTMGIDLAQSLLAAGGAEILANAYH